MLSGIWHMSPDVTGILPQVINRQKTVWAANAIDKEPIVSNRMYEPHLTITCCWKRALSALLEDQK